MLAIKKYCVLGVVLIATGCQVDNIVRPVSREEQARLAAIDNVKMVLGAGDALEITANALQTKGISIGRKVSGDAFGNCKPAIHLVLNIDRSRTDSLVYTGAVTASYGDGSTCLGTSLHNGTIRNEFRLAFGVKNKAQYSSTEIITFEGYRNGGAKYDGRLIVRSSAGKRISVNAVGARLANEDGTSSTWNGWLYFKQITPSTASGNTSFHVSGALNGITRQGGKYDGTIGEDVIFKADCSGKKEGIPVSGTMTVTIDGSQSTVNYGEGACDKKYTISVSGQNKEYTFG